MYRVIQTREFQKWVNGLRDRRAQRKIDQRLIQILAGNLGDWKSVGDGVSEMRIAYGPGYRLYFTVRDEVVVILLCGSDKSDQSKMIKRAKEMVRQI